MRKINLVIITCIFVSLVFWLLDSDALVEYLAFSGVNLLNGRAWTLVTSLFLHADIMHLAGNMLFLYIFGYTLEEELGAGKTLGAFFVGGIVTFPLSLLFYDWATNRPSRSSPWPTAWERSLRARFPFESRLEKALLQLAAGKPSPRITSDPARVQRLGHLGVDRGQAGKRGIRRWALESADLAHDAPLRRVVFPRRNAYGRTESGPGAAAYPSGRRCQGHHDRGSWPC